MTDFKQIEMLVHVEKREDFLTMLEICEANGVIWDEGFNNEKPTSNYDKWDFYKENTVIEIHGNKMWLCGSVEECDANATISNFEMFKKQASEIIISSAVEKPLIPIKKLIDKLEDIGIVAAIFEDLSRFLSSHTLVMKRKFTDINSIQVAKYACTANDIVIRLDMNIKVSVNEKEGGIIYEFIKA